MLKGRRRFVQPRTKGFGGPIINTRHAGGIITPGGKSPMAPPPAEPTYYSEGLASLNPTALFLFSEGWANPPNNQPWTDEEGYITDGLYKSGGGIELELIYGSRVTNDYNQGLKCAHAQQNTAGAAESNRNNWNFGTQWSMACAAQIRAAKTNSAWWRRINH